jgi:hypothetical protein
VLLHYKGNYYYFLFLLGHRGDTFKKVEVAKKKSWGFFNKRTTKKNKNGPTSVVDEGKVMELAEIDPELVYYECVV